MENNRGVIILNVAYSTELHDFTNALFALGQNMFSLITNELDEGLTSEIKPRTHPTGSSLVHV